MSEQTSSIISKVWGMCGPLRDDGVSYGDYLEQLTHLIFLKTNDEYAKPPYRNRWASRQSNLKQTFREANGL